MWLLCATPSRALVISSLLLQSIVDEFQCLDGTKLDPL